MIPSAASKCYDTSLLLSAQAVQMYCIMLRQVPEVASNVDGYKNRINDSVLAAGGAVTLTSAEPPRLSRVQSAVHDRI